jgi:PRTRC genetic system ThiF family protein
MYKLSNNLGLPYGQAVTIAVAGCGGTGSLVAEGLCRLLPAQMAILLVDHDSVESRNLVRQNFYKNELGMFKTEALAHRLSSKFERGISYLTTPVSRLEHLPELIIGCLDNGNARRDIAERIRAKCSGPYDRYRGWYIDAGNGNNYGQVLIGNHPAIGIGKPFERTEEVCFALPLPTEQHPELLVEVPPAPACAEAVMQNEQSPIINQCMAALVLEVVRRILIGTCPWMQLYLDMETGALNSTLATPENVAHMLGINVRSLTFVNNPKKEVSHARD